MPTGSLSSSVGEGKLWYAQTSARHSNHLSAFSARQAPWHSEQKIITMQVKSKRKETGGSPFNKLN